MSRNNRFRFSYQDLSRVVFEHELNTQNIVFRVEEQLDNYAVPGTPLYIYYISDEDSSLASKIYKSISSEDDLTYSKDLTKMTLGIILFIVFFLLMQYFSFL